MPSCDLQMAASLWERIAFAASFAMNLAVNLKSIEMLTPKWPWHAVEADWATRFRVEEFLKERCWLCGADGLFLVGEKRSF